MIIKFYLTINGMKLRTELEVLHVREDLSIASGVNVYYSFFSDNNILSTFAENMSCFKDICYYTDDDSWIYMTTVKII